MISSSTRPSSYVQQIDQFGLTFAAEPEKNQEKITLFLRKNAQLTLDPEAVTSLDQLREIILKSGHACANVLATKINAFALYFMTKNLPVEIRGNILMQMEISEKDLYLFNDRDRVEWINRTTQIPEIFFNEIKLGSLLKTNGERLNRLKQYTVSFNVLNSLLTLAPNLKELTLDRCIIQHDQYKFFFQTLNPALLTSLELKAIRIPEQESFTPFLVRFTSLTKLSLALNRLEAVDLIPLIMLENLKALDLRNNPIGHLGIRYLLSLKNLKELNLSATYIMDQDAVLLVNFEQLEVLILNDNWIRNEGARVLVALPKLKELSLAGNYVDDSTQRIMRNRFKQTHPMGVTVHFSNPFASSDDAGGYGYSDVA